MGPATITARSCPRVDRIKAAAEGIWPADRRRGPAHTDQCFGGSCVSGAASDRFNLKWAQGSRIDAETIIQRRERIKRKTIDYRRFQHHKLAA